MQRTLIVHASNYLLSLAADVMGLGASVWLLSMYMAPGDLGEPETEVTGQTSGSSGSSESDAGFIEQPEGPTPDEHQRRLKRFEPIYGPTMLSAVIMAGADSAGVSLNAARFVIPWLGLGFDIDESIVFEKPSYNDFSVAGNVWFVMTPHLRASPYVRAGLGGEFFSGGHGVYGQWKGGMGVVVRLETKRRFAFGLGFEILGRFPNARFERNLPCMLTPTPCSLAIRPEIGLSVHFG
jgi:hypothetical protein